MCAVSMVSGHFQQRFPDPQQFPSYLYPDYQELIRKAKLYDEMTKQHDCQDPKKAEWEKQLREFMEKNYQLQPK